MLTEFKQDVDQEILNYFKEIPHNAINEAMAYSMNQGGKRLRPSLVFLSSEIFGGTRAETLPMALAMEMIHTYSLIHDDLPAMDNDVLRRGKPTSHVVFGEALAILAGDALLNEAMTILLENYAVKGKSGAEAALMISKASGREGMILGQVLDLENEKKRASYEELVMCHNHKTGDLIAASLTAPAIYFGATEEEIKTIHEFGIKLGLAFQIQDDILDKTSTNEVLGKSTGKDEKSGKTTYVELFGIDRSREMMKDVTAECLESLKSLKRDTAKLADLSKTLMERSY
ncbi:MAG: polyprenyl synthetase family protein [Clostridiaceae bacterium]